MTLPGLSTFPDDRVTLLETNPPFVEAALVGLNHELNRELLWREYPTDQAGTPFARFWPGSVPEYPEIARWDDAAALGGHDQMRGVPTVNLLVRAEVLRRYPGTILLAAQPEQGSRVLSETGGTWREPVFALPVDERTTIFGFDLTRGEVEDAVRPWMFVLREPMRGTQFGFDLATDDVPAGTPTTSLSSWADLIWDQVPVERGFARPHAPLASPPGQAAQWGTTSADLAVISFQRPFQLAFSPKRLLP